MRRIKAKTMDDILAFASMYNIDKDDLEHMGFYIGANAYKAKSYGIYRDPDTDEIVTYKNKADGTHVEHYRGKNEKKAVRQIMKKLLTAMEYNYRKKYPPTEEELERADKRDRAKCMFQCSLFLVVLIQLSVLYDYFKDPQSGYYVSTDTEQTAVYYLQDKDLYAYNAARSIWELVAGAYDISDYEYYGSTYDGAGESFYDSGFWNGETYTYDSSSSGSSYDDGGSDTDSDWDDGWDDWDSDW